MTINYKISHLKFLLLASSAAMMSHPRNGRHPGEFELWPIFHSIYLIPTLNLRPGLNSVAFFYIYSKISSFQTGLLHGLHL